MSHTFGRGVRLSTRAEYTAVQDAGRRVSGRYLTLLGRSNGLGRDRLGIIASRRVGGAVVRNRAKRRLREIFRREAPEAVRDDRPTVDFVAIARKELAGAPFADVDADVRAAFGKLRNLIR
ncbi:MAG TPA: ribonuclease P protein component [Vicinamibacterales bacterium]|nr:ribonuclease P protein component [Vicinamibacterales bacterium]